MTCRCSPSLLVLRRQLDAVYPARSIGADGCCASAQHHAMDVKAGIDSDHDPDAAGYAHAYDVTHDPLNGPHGDTIAAGLLRDPRTKYVIWNRHINTGDGWRAYHGPDPHTGHVHLSILPTATFDERPWAIGNTPPPPALEEEPYMQLVIEAENTAHRWLIGPGVALHVPDPNVLGQLELAWGKATKTLARSVIELHAKVGLTR